MKPEIHRFDDEAGLAEQAASFIVGQACEAVSERGRFSMAISGGNSPRGLFAALASESFSKEMPWASTHLFWVDERLVSPKSPDSNFGMASGLLISKVDIPKGNVHRIPVELMNPTKIAAAYEGELIRFFEGSDWALLDLALLGVGTDGHTASLFPGSKLLGSKSWVVPVPDPATEPGHPRITMTLEFINRARCAAFVVIGEGKRAVVDGILSGEPSSEELPAAMVKPPSELVWFILAS